MLPQDSQSYDFDIYISYASDDREIVARLVRQLTAAGFRIWWDQELRPGDAWETALNETLANTPVLILCLGQRSLSSRYQLEEYHRALALKKKLIPVRLRGFAGFEGLPDPLRSIQLLDYENEDSQSFNQLVTVIREALGKTEREPEQASDFVIVHQQKNKREADQLAAALQAQGKTALRLDSGAEELGKGWDELRGKISEVVVLLSAGGNSSFVDQVLDTGALAVVFTDSRPRPPDYPMLKGRDVPQLLWYNFSPEYIAEILGDPAQLAINGVPRCPYAGREPHFGQDPIFYGREREIKQLAQRFSSAPRLVILTGPARSGKTSLVQAGLWKDVTHTIPLVDTKGNQSWSWLTVEEDPYAELRQWKRQTLEGDVSHTTEDGQWIVDQKALAEHATEQPLAEAHRRVHPDRTSFLCVDQFERAFDAAPESAAAFIDDLIDAVEKDSGIYLLLIVREESLAHCRSNRRLNPWVDQALFVLEPMQRDGLQAAIEGPAGEFGLMLEEGLTERVLADVQRLDYPLEALSATMKALWYQRVDDRLTLAAYEALGGAEQVLKRAQNEPAPAAPEPGRLMAGYQADSIDTDDQLNIGPIVEAFCSVMLSKTVEPPLSIGLFGDWGSGKSFFMEEMWRQVEDLAREAREQADHHWHGHVAQIRFNAWHYSDANLWAAFVTHIFEELAQIINPGTGLQETRTKLLAELDTSRALRDEAQFELDQANEVLSQAKTRLQQQREELQQKRSTLAGIRRHDLKAMIQDPEFEGSHEAQALQDELNRLSDELGLGRTYNTFKELAAAVKQAKSIMGQARALWLEFKRNQSSRRQMLLALLVLLLPAIAGLAVYLIGAFTATVFFRETVVRIVAIAGQAAFLVRALVKYLPPVRDNLKKLNDVRERLRALTTKREQVLLAPIQQEVAVTQARVERAAESMDRAQERVVQAENALREASAGRRFYKFIEERSSSTDYKQHLGMISMVHRDFQKLHNLLIDCSTYLPDTSEDAGDEDTRKSEPTRRIDRIILYIDDLDRCHPKLVVEVLQAIHLLLALPLFIVVVGVDSRWLLRALEVYYPEFLSIRRRRSAKSDGSPEDGDEPATTPQNYLEKIFQIPFCLPAMGAGGFSNLISYLVTPPDSGAVQPEEQQITNVDPPKFENTGAKPSAIMPQPPVDNSTADPAQRDVAPSQPLHPAQPSALDTDPATREAEGQPSAVDQPRTPAPVKPPGSRKVGPEKTKGQKKRLPSPRAVSISSEEAEFMQELHALIQTPRGTKRFVNVYRLLRAIAVKDDDVFLGRSAPGVQQIQPEYRVALTLLALNIGAPYYTGHISHLLERGSAENKWSDLVKSLQPAYLNRKWMSPTCGPLTEEEAGAWMRITGCLNRVGQKFPMPTTLKTYKIWAQKVHRFSFWPLEEAPPVPPPTRRAAKKVLKGEKV